MSAADFFFRGSVNGATGHADCAYCNHNSANGGGRWNSGRTGWVCDEHISLDDQHEATEREATRRGILNAYGHRRGRQFLVFDTEPGNTVEVDGLTFNVAQKFWSDGDDSGEYDQPAGWYVRIS